MLQDLYPHVYHNEMAWKAPAPDDIALIFTPDRTIYCGLEGSTLTLPRMQRYNRRRGAVQRFPLTKQRIISSPLTPGETDAFRYPSFRVAPRHDGRDKRRPVRRRSGESLHRWYDSQKFCGRCGARMEKSAVERAMVCPQCKNTVYPKICPGCDRCRTRR